MAFTVEIKRKALRFIEELDEKRKHRIAETILVLKDDPVPFKREDEVKLKGYDSTIESESVNLGSFTPYHGTNGRS